MKISLRNLPAQLARPFNFALLIGVVTATLVFYVGKWSVEPNQVLENQELQILADDIAQGYLIGQLSPTEHPARLALQQAVVKAVQHPCVTSASFVTSSNETVATATKGNDRSSIQVSEMRLPIKDETGRLLGTALLGLNHAANEAGWMSLSRARWFGGLGFLLGFALSISILRRKNTFLPQLMAAIKKVSAGHMDLELAAPPQPEFSELAHAFNNMLEGLRERDRMRHSLGRIMDPKIAEILIKENPRVGGLRREATILFCDIRNYTSICEQLSPDQLQEFLNEYWKDTVEIIMEQEGTIDKFHGDGVCVVFGAPTLHSDDSVRAVRTAWRLVQNVEKINKRRELQRKTPIQIGVGIHNGEVIAGHIGSERRMDYTVVGDVVNVAARIEELNKKFGTTILISDSVYEEVEDNVRVKTITLAHLRGHKRPILVHTVREFFETETARADTAPENSASSISDEAPENPARKRVA